MEKGYFAAINEISKQWYDDNYKSDSQYCNMARNSTNEEQDANAIEFDNDPNSGIDIEVERESEINTTDQTPLQ